MRSTPKHRFWFAFHVTSLAGLIGILPLASAVAAEAVNTVTAQATPEALHAWRENLKALPSAEEGCFRTTFPSMSWEKVACTQVPTARIAPPHIPDGLLDSLLHPGNAASASGRVAGNVANGVASTSENGVNKGSILAAGGLNGDYVVQTANLTTSAIGEFPTVLGVTAASDANNPNGYTLQLNTNYSTQAPISPACARYGYALCQTWQQFVYGSNYNGFGSTDVVGAQVFIQNWFFVKTSDFNGSGLSPGPGCPVGWSSVVQAPNIMACMQNSRGTAAPNVSLADLANVSLSGVASTKDGLDVVTFFNGIIGYKATQSADTLNIGSTWNQSQFNVVANGGTVPLSFENGSSLTVKVQANDGTANAPSCLPGGTTAESNNLDLKSCVAGGGASPYIQYTQAINQLLDNPGFESKADPWARTSTNANGAVDCSDGCSSLIGVKAHTGTGFAKLNGYGTAATDSLSQSVTIPINSSTPTLQYNINITTAETTPTDQNDTLTVGVYDSSGNLLKTLASYSNLDANSDYVPYSHDLSAYIGQTVTIKFTGTENASLKTTFLLDDVTLTTGSTPKGSDTPTAGFTSTANGLTATFTDASTAASGDSIGSRAWTFGDGTTSTTTSPSHTYAKAGTYNVTETVTNATNKRVSFSTKSVTVSGSANSGPSASFSYTTNGLTVTFTDTSTDAGGTIGSRSWAFGDGSTSTVANPSHIYAVAGTYNVTETVTESGSGKQNSAVKSVTVSGGGSSSTALTNGVALTGLWGLGGLSGDYTLTVPAGKTFVIINLSEGIGRADLYVKLNAAPTLSSYDRSSYLIGNNEMCMLIPPPEGGTYHIKLNAANWAYWGASLTGSYY